MLFSLNALLPPRCYASTEETFQITRRQDKATIGADVMVVRTQSEQTGTPRPAAQVNTPTLVMPAATAEELVEAEEFNSLVIYRIDEAEVPVTRIELLSPANKPAGSHYLLYLRKRIETLQSGLRLVEIDYLHTIRPVIRRIPSYPDRAHGAYPYTITVTDPRPDPEEGEMKVYGFGVLDPLPVIEIPLANSDTVALDMGAVYQTTFNSSRVFYRSAN